MSGTTLPGMVLAAAEKEGGRPAFVEGSSGAVVTYELLAGRIRAVAAGLGAHGYREGDVLALWGPNRPQWAGVALGAMAAGGCVTGVPPAASEPEVVTQLRDSGASLLVTSPSLAPVACRAAQASAVRGTIALGEAPGTTPIETLLAHGSAALAGDDGAPAFLPYSSGTTGLPKGVVLTHGNLVSAVRQAGRGLRLTPRDTLIAIVPFCHVMGFVITMALPLAAGATVVTMPRFELARFLELLERHRVTVAAVPPPVAAALAGHPLVDDHDLSSLELIVSGGAPLSSELQRRLSERFPHAAVGQGYGMTETSVGITAPDREQGTAPGSVGRVMASTELRVVDPDTGADLGAGERGELWVRGPQVMRGYLNRPEATAATLDAEGWLRTGDLGLVDGDGNVFVVDRLKELIKVSAHQVAPAELEALLVTHPAVADAAVVGRHDERHGEVPVAVVVPRAELDEEALIAWVAERVAPYKRLREVRFAESIPRTPAGKIMRRLIETQAVEAQRTSLRTAIPSLQGSDGP